MMVLVVIGTLGAPKAARAQEATPAVDALQKQIDDLKNKISDLQGQEKTLTNQIAVMDSQIKLTEVKIEATKEAIAQLAVDIDKTKQKIDELDVTLTSMATVLIKRIAATYEAEKMPVFQFLADTGTMENYVRQMSYLKAIQAHDKQLMYTAQVTQNSFQDQKQLLEAQKKKQDDLQKQLIGYTANLNQQKSQKNDLLTQTRGSEANYAKLLAQAQAQLQNFRAFVNSQGGDQLLSNQTSCDDWGCYYNQRDSQWGPIPLNNTHYTIASDGCLLTDVAMVFTHFGHRSVNPITINSNPDNFASYEPAWLSKTVYADGATLTRISADVDGELNAGRPVIVGISYDGGPLPDHFVTLISGSNGNYRMHDPYLKDGHNVPFTDHYSVKSIREINKIQIQ